MRARVILLASCSLWGCRVAGETPKERNEQINRGLLERLSGEALTPVEDFDQESYFEQLERLYADAPAKKSGGPEGGIEAESPGAMNPYIELGAGIWPAGDGFFVKHYSFPKDMGASIQHLAMIYADFPVIHAVDGEGLPETAEQQPEAAVLDLRTSFDAESFNPPRSQGVSAPNLVPLADWILVRARPEVMLEVEHFFDLFAAEKRQIEIEAKIVEVTTSDSTDWGIRPTDQGTPIFDLPNSGSFINEVGFSFGNAVDAGEALFGVTSVFDGVKFNALLEMVAEHENVSIISRPKVAVREGAQAEIVNTTSIPFFQIKAINAAGNFTTQLAFQEVGTQMYVIPRVIGEDTIILNIDIEVSQETGTAITFAQGGDGPTVAVPEISNRIARTIVRLQPGQAVILGGLISERIASRETRIPVLGDIPLLGYLFRNEYRVKEQTNVLFFIRPRVLQGIDFQDF